ncbi:MAG TPA: SURF1 family protein [Gemmatimonadales bacterium]|nr:SURF1 family protein [Gemmatimonadales bacterium]
MLPSTADVHGSRQMSPTSRRLFIVFLMASAAICARLGFWQVGRLQERRAANRAAAEARAEPVVRLPGGASGGRLENRRVEAVGRYDDANEIVLRGSSYQGMPGVTLVTPLRIRDSDTALLVTRGFVPSPDAVTVGTDSLREPGEVRVVGVALPIDSGRGRPLERNGGTTWAALDAAALRDRLPYPFYPVAVRQSPDPSLPRVPRRLEPPALDDGPHLSYAVQWFLFATMAVVFAGVVVARWRS